MNNKQKEKDNNIEINVNYDEKIMNSSFYDNKKFNKTFNDNKKLSNIQLLGIFSVLNFFLSIILYPSIFFDENLILSDSEKYTIVSIFSFFTLIIFIINMVVYFKADNYSKV